MGLSSDLSRAGAYGWFTVTEDFGLPLDNVTSRNRKGLQNMGRKRRYANATERQRACRERAKSATKARPAPRSLKQSRPKRLVALEDGIRDLLGEYAEWLEQLPDSLDGTAQAEALAAAIEGLTEAADLLAAITPPRGFGRD